MRVFKKILYVVVVFYATAMYGFVMYVSYLNITAAGGTMFDAYINNIISILVMLALDKLKNYYLAKRCVVTKRNRLFAMFVFFDSIVSIKTTLYLFYIFVIVASRVSIMQPDLINETFRGFVLSIEYCLILVIAFDKLMEHITKDMKRIREISEKFKKYKAEKQDQLDRR